jgi:hypothetical protein
MDWQEPPRARRVFVPDIHKADVATILIGGPPTAARLLVDQLNLACIQGREKSFDPFGHKPIFDHAVKPVER